jgi:hypothetical protein
LTVDSGWLSALVSAVERHDAAAVASKILDWTGETIESATRADSTKTFLQTSKTSTAVGH